MKRIIILAVFILLAIAGIIIFVTSSGDAVTQPVAFNHKVHIENNIECSGCHETVETGAHAGRPKMETCMVCHETPMSKTDAAEEEKVRQYAERSEEIPWRRLYRLPDAVFFSHRTHVVAGKVECKTCHGKIGESTTPPPRAEVSLRMSDCIDCHRSQKVTTDCLACHK